MLSQSNLHSEIREIAKRNFIEIKREYAQTVLSEEEISSTITISPQNTRMLKTLWKLGWLLGENIRIVSPFTFIEDHVYITDTIGEDPHLYHYFVDKRFLEWEKELINVFKEYTPKIVPGHIVNISKDLDFDEDYSSGERISFKSDNIEKCLFTLAGDVNYSNIGECNIDIPSIIINDYNLLKKVQNDYPIASFEFKKLIKNSYTTMENDDETPALILERLNDEIIQPGIMRIKSEHKEILKSSIIKSVAQTSAMAIPIFFNLFSSGDYASFITSIMSAGIGLKIANNLVELRAKKIDIKKQAYWAAVKMQL